MFKYFFIVIFSFNILGANENTVKTSELELFLFKVGFESLLKDVDINKSKSTLNEQEIKVINEKIELIMTELYKDKRVLFNNSNETRTILSNKNQELEALKKEIAFLKKEILELKKKKSEKTIPIKKEKITIPKKIKLEKNKKRIAYNIAKIYSKPFSNSTIIKELKRDDIIYIDFCDKYGWCKLENAEGYIKGFLIKP